MRSILKRTHKEASLRTHAKCGSAKRSSYVQQAKSGLSNFHQHPTAPECLCNLRNRPYHKSRNDRVGSSPITDVRYGSVNHHKTRHVRSPEREPPHDKTRCMPVNDTCERITTPPRHIPLHRQLSRKVFDAFFANQNRKPLDVVHT